MVMVVHIWNVPELLAAYQAGEITREAAVGRLVQMGRSLPHARALVGLCAPSYAFTPTACVRSAAR